jgi:hypothetical protein
MLFYPKVRGSCLGQVNVGAIILVIELMFNISGFSF